MSTVGWADVIWIPDGDTIKVRAADGKMYFVRYICMNTPETDEPFYEEAKAMNIRLAGQRVWLERESSNVDRHGLLLRHVYTDESRDVLIGEELIRAGMAHTYPFKPDVELEGRFREAEIKAKAKKLGIWSQSKKKKDRLDYYSKAIKKGMSREMLYVAYRVQKLPKPSQRLVAKSLALMADTFRKVLSNE